MDSSTFDALILKASALITVTGTTSSAFWISGAHLPFFNVTMSTLGMSAAGSMLAFAYGTPIKSRKKLYGYAVGGTFIGIWGVQLMLWQDVVLPPEFRPPVAGAIALLSRWIVPFLVDNFAIIGARIFGRTPPAGDS